MEIIDKERIEILKQDLEEDFKDVYQELLTLYENDFAPQKSRLADEIASENYSAAATTTHQLKGGARNVGMAKLSSTLAEIETALKGGQKEIALRLQSGLDNLFREALPEAQKLIS